MTYMNNASFKTPRYVHVDCTADSRGVIRTVHHVGRTLTGLGWSSTGRVGGRNIVYRGIRPSLLLRCLISVLYSLGERCGAGCARRVGGVFFVYLFLDVDLTMSNGGTRIDVSYLGARVLMGPRGVSYPSPHLD